LAGDRIKNAGTVIRYRLLVVRRSGFRVKVMGNRKIRRTRTPHILGMITGALSVAPFGPHPETFKADCGTLNFPCGARATDSSELEIRLLARTARVPRTRSQLSLRDALLETA
jgi:hypothetical protein